MGRFLVFFLKSQNKNWADNYIDYPKIKGEIKTIVKKMLTNQENYKINKQINNENNNATFEEEEIYNTSLNLSIDFNNLSTVSNPIDLFQESIMSDNEIRRGQLNFFIELLKSEIEKIYKFVIQNEQNLAQKYMSNIQEISVDNTLINYVNQSKVFYNLAKETQLLSFYAYLNMFALSKIMQHLTKKLQNNIAKTTYFYLNHNLETCNRKLFYMLQFIQIDSISILLEEQSNAHLHAINIIPSITIEDNKIKEDIIKYSIQLKTKLNSINEDYIQFEECLKNYIMSLQIEDIDEKIQEYHLIENNCKSNGTNNEMKFSMGEQKRNAITIYLIIFFNAYYVFCYTNIIISNQKAIDNVLHLEKSYCGCVVYLAPIGCFISLFIPKLFHKNSYKIPILLSIISLMISHLIYILSIAYKSLLLMMISRFVLGLGSNYLLNKSFIDRLNPISKRKHYQNYLWISSMIGISIGFIIDLFTSALTFIGNVNKYFNAYQINSYIGLIIGICLLLTIGYFFENPSHSRLDTSIINIGDISSPFIILNDKEQVKTNDQIRQRVNVLIKQEIKGYYSHYIMKSYLFFLFISLSMKLSIETLFVFSAYYFVENAAHLNESRISMLLGASAFLALCITLVGNSLIKNHQRITLIILLIMSLLGCIGIFIDFLLSHINIDHNKIAYSSCLCLLLILAFFLDMITNQLSIQLIPEQYEICSTKWNLTVSYFSTSIQILPGLLIGLQCLFWIPAYVIGSFIYAFISVLLTISLILLIVFYDQITLTSFTRLNKVK